MGHRAAGVRWRRQTRFVCETLEGLVAHQRRLCYVKNVYVKKTRRTKAEKSAELDLRLLAAKCYPRQ